MKLSLLLALFTVFSAHATNDFECSSPTIGTNNYSYKIKVNETSVQIQQSAINARYTLIVKEIYPTSFQGAPAENLLFTCSKTEAGIERYSVRINVYETTMTVQQSSRSARYRTLAFDLK